MPKRLTFMPLAVPVAAGCAAAAFAPMQAWADLRTSLLPAMSVIAAAILVRLNRGFPFSNADQFTLDEARNVIGSIIGIVKSLRTLIIVTIFSMLWIAVVPSLAPYVGGFLQGWHATACEAAFSATLGVSVAYCVVRIIQVVQSDVELAILQGSLLERSIQRKAASQFQQQQKPPAGGGATIAGASGFGRPLQ